MKLVFEGAIDWQEEFTREILSWPELPIVDRHQLHLMYGADMRTGVLAHAGSTGIVFSERMDEKPWADFERFATVLVHEWAHVWDINHMSEAERNRLMVLGDWPERYTWRAHKESYYTQPIECFAAEFAEMVCWNRLRETGVNDRYRDMDRSEIRRITMPMPDIKDEDQELVDAVHFLLANDITTGYPDGEFKPNRPVSRGEMARFLYRALKGGDE